MLPGPSPKVNIERDRELKSERETAQHHRSGAVASKQTNKQAMKAYCIFARACENLFGH